MKSQIENEDYPELIIDLPAMPSMQIELAALKKQIDKMLAACEDADISFRDHQPICKICYGSGWAPLYRGGKRTMTRCASSYLEPNTVPPTLKCSGSPQAVEWWQRNHKDLSAEIWRLVMRIGGTEEQMSAYIVNKFHVEWLDTLMIEQLEYILIKLNQRLAMKGKAA